MVPGKETKEKPALLIAKTHIYLLILFAALCLMSFSKSRKNKNVTMQIIIWNEMDYYNNFGQGKIISLP